MTHDGDKGNVEGSSTVWRRLCTFRKNDFLPEESFQSLGNYGRALLDTPKRFKDRLLTRSTEHIELVEVKSQSQPG
ncbi:hypothetical protein QN277_018823 [Acacia crassicarpa]|uniref:Uncharacterized protein n=1 Tax=Acacia crassicarpa TaxID=499986 RepID=A0AAE1MUY0_9FABA|nr:hypothetical protein QN277_018823 [Acacia crassicarpa]